MNIKEEIKKIILKALEKMEITNIDVVLEIPNDKKNGDYATSVAMQLSSLMKKNSIAIANEIKDLIETSEYIDKIEIAGPGFLNFYINKKILLNLIPEVLEQKEDYGRSKIGNGQKINVEFASVNPTGVIHLGHARGSAYGDNICRILSFAGYDVTREYYINDGGNQIDNLGKSIQERYFGLCGLEENMPEDGYYGKEIVEIAKNIYEKEKGACLDKPTSYFKDIGLNVMLNQIKEDLLNFRVRFDVWTSEKKIREAGRIEEALEILTSLGKTYTKENAIWLKSSDYGDEKDRVLVKSDNEYAYITPDIAYHLDKFDRGYDMLIDVFGADHHGYVPRLKAAIEALGYEKEKLEVKIIQMVRLLRGGEEVKMSKRTGNVVSVNDLVEEVGIDAARYFFAMRNIDSQMDFDIELAIKKAQDNPVYYVSYAHARICSLLKNKELKKVDQFRTIDSEYAYDILSKISEFKNVVEASALKRLPHLITNYVYDLANALHIYYNNEQILTDDDEYTNERLLLVKAVKIVINNALNLIGVKAPEEM
ncbi:MAG TPA: arginine--tRNA ligase [Mollicutes bacterium]|nr:arginine--tRNA ligase [Mollicutes bacterium]